MAIYDEKTHVLIENPDLEKGYLYPGKLLISDSENSTELEGTDGLKVYHSEPVYEDCQFYHEYTAEEMPLNLLQTSYSIRQTSPNLSYKITTVYLNDYDVEGPDYTICFGTWGSYGIEQIQVIRGSGWEDLTIKATFNVKGERTAVLVPETGIINVPPEATRYPLDAKNPGYIVFTGVSNGVQRNSKNLMYLVYGHAEADLMNAQSTPSEWEQFVTQVEAYVDASEARVKQYATNAKASENAAAESAIKAKEEAQKALGFRSLYSAVLPSGDADLDPSRPIESKSYTSVTVKSLGDRLKSVKVNGFTADGQNAGTRMVEYTLTGSENYTTVSGWQPGSFSVNNFFAGAKSVSGYGTKALLYCNQYKTATASQIASVGAVGVAQGNGTTLYINIGAQYNLDTFKRTISDLYNAGTPIKLWAEAETTESATGLYIPIEIQGHEYRCQCLPITEALGVGSNVQSNVRIPCDVEITLDGSSDEVWSVYGTSVSGKYRMRVLSTGLVSGISIPQSNFVVADIFSDRYSPESAAANYRANPGIAVEASSGNIYIFDENFSGENSLDEWKSNLAQNPIKIRVKTVNYTASNGLFVELETHANGNVYAHDAVELEAIPYTKADETSAQNLASTPSTLPYIEDADVPMLLNEVPTLDESVQETENIEENSVSSEIATLSTTLPVAGTYIVSSQEGTTVSVFLKPFQDGGDAKTLCGKSIDDLNNESIGWLGSFGVIGGKIGDPSFDVINFNVASCNNSDVLVVCLTSNTGMRTVNLAMARESGMPCVLTCKSDNAAYEDTVLCAKVYTDRIKITSVVSGNTDDSYCMEADVYKLGGIKPV